MRTRKTVLEKGLAKQRRFKLASVDTRSTFLLVQPTIQETSKMLLTVATVTFAGSLTFLGLRENLSDTNPLKWSWAILALSVAMHLFVRLQLSTALLAMDELKQKPVELKRS